MPDKETMRKIADEAGVSETTVHRALNNCGNVNACTKVRILRAAGSLGVSSNNRSGKCTVGILIRSKPHFFWDVAYNTLREMAHEYDLPLSVSVCSEWQDDTDFLYCLDSLEKHGVDTYIVTPISSPAAKKRLTELAKSHTVIFLCEDCDVPNSYYVGVDPEQDGSSFAEAVLPMLPPQARVLTVGSGEVPIADRRCEAFLKTVTERLPGAKAVGRIDLDFSASPNTPSILARTIHEQYDDAFDVLFVSQGVLPQVTTALYKLRIHRKVLCFGFETVGHDDAPIENGTVDAVMIQNIRGQARRCIEIAKAVSMGQTVPRNTYLPSKIEFSPRNDKEQS